jgi:hypothetical protein
MPFLSTVIKMTICFFGDFHRTVSKSIPIESTTYRPHICLSSCGFGVSCGSWRGWDRGMPRDGNCSPSRSTRCIREDFRAIGRWIAVPPVYGKSLEMRRFRGFRYQWAEPHCSCAPDPVGMENSEKRSSEWTNGYIIGCPGGQNGILVQTGGA